MQTGASRAFARLREGLSLASVLLLQRSMASALQRPGVVRPPASSSEPTPNALERAIGRQLLRRIGDPFGALVLPNGHEVRLSESGPASFRMSVSEWSALLALLGPTAELHFGDAFANGAIRIEGDLVAFLERTFRTMPIGGLMRRFDRLRRRVARRANSLRLARDNVHRHYDLGNDFYALWLDREMVYTCAYFPDPDVSLETAQRAKMDLVARKLRLRPEERVVELGSGWGALAIHLARRHGVRVRAFNISEEQLAFARDRARREGLASRVEFIADDYRNATGSADALVSVGMLEHVGPENYAALAQAIDRVVTPEGRGLLHFIGRNRPYPFNEWIERRIFPGAHAPSLRESLAVLEPSDFSVLDVENLRLHYARTLEHWLLRFEAHRDEVVRRFDERFVRMWRLYLAGSIASFRTGSLQLFQVVFARGRSNHVPWTRAHLFAPDVEISHGAL